MLGKPLFGIGDSVEFTVKDQENKYTMIGTVAIVDPYGTFEQNKQASYDIMVKYSHFTGEPCLYKHVTEDEVKKAIG